MSTSAQVSAQAGRSYHHGDLRSALVCAAVARVEEVGAEHVSLRAVAAEVGVSPSAAYHHFADKDALLGEVAATGLHMLVESVGTEVAAIAGDSREAARLRFRAAGQAYVSFALSHPQLFRVAFSPYCLEHPGVPTTDDGSVPVLSDLLNDLVSTGGMNAAVRDDSEDVFVATLHGLATLALQGMISADRVPALLAKIEQLIGVND
ncbi:MAG: TetR/AcrR family transcriptional regulator [Actinomycetes bacterium]